MCGIAGICLSDPDAVVPEDLLRAMTGVLEHRGPDGEGFLLKNNIGLGHRRLSIIDLEGGDQPIYNENGRIGIVFNGEIYNYLELMDDLKRRGHQFATHSDTEVIVHLYEELGPRCVDHLRGMFSFAVWDGRDNSVFLARDRLGIKPLFYTIRDDRFLFASELKALIQDTTIPREVDEATLVEYLSFGYVPGDRCILKGIEKVPPGCTLTWRNHQTHLRQYWDVGFPDDANEGQHDRVEELQEVLGDAMRLHLRADVPVGVLLSGGVDSATMVALASQYTSAPIKTFSVGFEQQEYNELKVARLSAQRYQTQHHEIIVTDRDLSVLEKIVWHLDEPFADPSALPTYYVCREAARHVKVCLTGDGADEVFAGYTRYRIARSYEKVDRIPSWGRRGLFGTAAALMPQIMWGKGLLTRLSASGARRYLHMIGIFSESECATMLAGHPRMSREKLTRILDPFFDVNGRSALTALQHADQKTYLPDDILVKADRMSMQNSLEVRPPFLDHEVVEFANACPPGIKIDQNVSKAVLKNAMRDLIPKPVIDRKKSGFGLPIKDWFRGGLEPFARDMLLAPSTRCTAFFDRKAVKRIVTGHQFGMRDLSRRIWSLLVFEQWCRSYGV